MVHRVATSEYRRRLRAWHDLVRRGQDVVVTDNGVPVVRVTSADADTLIDRLEREGLLRRATTRRVSDEMPRIAAPGDSTAAVTRSRDR